MGAGQEAFLRGWTWQLHSSGGSVVFKGQVDNHFLVVEATSGSDHHYFFFPIHVVAIGG